MMLLQLSCPILGVDEGTRPEPYVDGEEVRHGSGVAGGAGRGACQPTTRFLQILIKNWSWRWLRTFWTMVIAMMLVLGHMGMVRGAGMVLGPWGVHQEV